MDYIIIVLKCMFIYAYLIVLLRFLGKKEFSQLSIFDFVVFLIISELMIMHFDGNLVELINSIVATLTLVIIDKVCSFFTLKNKKFRDLLEGTPVYIIFQGKVDHEAMKKHRYNIDSLCQHLRSQQIDSISDVEFAILETNGDLSVFLKKECKVRHPEPVVSDGEFVDEVLEKLKMDRKWVIKELKRLNILDYKEVFYALVEKNRLFVIKKNEK